MKDKITVLPTAKVLIQDEATALIAQAIDKNVSVDVMERLLTIRRELKAERAKEEFDKAMASFQAEMPTIEKKVQGYNYKYADLTSIIEQVKELLAKNGFSYTFDTKEEANKIIVFCRVKHIGGHSEVSEATITKETTTKMNASQQSGAAMTYGKRYAFVNSFGILTGEEDLDGKTGKNNELPVKHPESPVKATTAPSAGNPTATSKPSFTKERMVSMKQETLILSQLARTGKRLVDMTQGKTAHQSDLTMQEASNVIKILLALPSKKVEAEESEPSWPEEE